MVLDHALGPFGAPPSARVLDLAMQRQDIADYLGLTIETVSRTFTFFRDRGFLRLPRKRRVEIMRPEALRGSPPPTGTRPQSSSPRTRHMRLQSPNAPCSEANC